MSASHPTKATKPSKPYPEHPLTAHPAGCLCKKIGGKLHYFGPGDDPEGALTKYEGQKYALHAGKQPKAGTEEGGQGRLRRVHGRQGALVDAGELSKRLFVEYKEVCRPVITQFGKARPVRDLDPADLAALRKKMAKRWGPVRRGNAIQRVRTVLKYAEDAALVARPVVFGPDFK
jgi:hypothetical protein